MQTAGGLIRQREGEFRVEEESVLFLLVRSTIAEGDPSPTREVGSNEVE
jgi:hypothetical protein